MTAAEQYDPDFSLEPAACKKVAAAETLLVTRIIQQRPGQTIILVGHDATNRLILLMALGLPLARFHGLTQDPGAVSRLGHDRERWTVHSMNETAQLAPSLGRHRQEARDHAEHGHADDAHGQLQR